MNRRIVIALAVLALFIGLIGVAVAQGVNVSGIFDPQPEPTGGSQGQSPAPDGDPEPAAPAPSAEPDASGIPAGAWRATVTYVHDGDTIYLDGEKVRLIGIDTPEVGESAECYGEEARELARDLLPEGQRVWAIEDRDPYDHYDRWLLYVFTEDGIFVNLELVELGAAEAIRVGGNDAYWPELRDAQRSAQGMGLGMWGSC